MQRKRGEQMSAVLPPASDLGAMSDVSSRLAFFKNLQGVTTKIHATTNIDVIRQFLNATIDARELGGGLWQVDVVPCT